MKRRRVVFAPEARDDLFHLYDWIASRGGPQVAIGYLDRLEAHCRRLEYAPERGLRRDDIREGLRILGFERKIAVAFVVGDEAVTILRIFAGGRNWETDLR